MEIFSANEYWVKAASLMTTDPTGTKDLPDSPFTRIYFMSSMQHGTAAPVKGRCQQLQNPLDSQAVQRALFTAMDKWVTAGTPPPAEPVSRSFRIGRWSSRIRNLPDFLISQALPTLVSKLRVTC